MTRRKSGGFFGGAFALMLSGIAVKLIGALFSVPLANLYGADGNDIFISAYYVYAAMYVVSSAGLPAAVSKLVAEARAQGRGAEVRRIGRVAFAAFLLLGIALSTVLLLLLDPICALVGETCRYALTAVAPTVLFTCLVSAARGYYQGLSDMTPTAVSQVIEALGKLVFGLGLARRLSDSGYPLDVVVAGAMVGVTVGTALSALYALLYALRHRSHGLPEDGPCRPAGTLLRQLLRLALPITAGASVFSISSLADTLLVKLRLRQGCLLTEAAAGFSYGAYGFAVKLFNLPLSLVTAIGISLIPAISGAQAVGRRDRALSLTESALRLTGLLAFPCAAGLAVIPGPVLRLLFGSQPAACALAEPLLRELAPAVVLAGLVSVTGPVLQALGRPGLPVVSMAAGGAVKLLSGYVLVGLPEVGIRGAPLSSCLCYGVMLALNLCFLARQGMAVPPGRTFGRTLACAACMGAFVLLLRTPLARLTGGTVLTALLSVCCGGVFYLLLLLASRALPREDLEMLPRGGELVKKLEFRRKNGK